MKKICKAIISKKYLLVLVLSLIMLLSTIGFTFAWYNGISIKLYNNQTNKRDIAQLAALKANVDVIGYRLDSTNALVSTPFYSDEEVEEDDSLTIQSGFINDSFEPGALNKLNTQDSNYTTKYYQVIANNTSTRYFRVANRSDINIMVKMIFEIEGDSEDGLADLTSFWYLVTDVTNSINNQTGDTYEEKLQTYASLNKSSRIANNFNETNPNTDTFETVTRDLYTNTSKVKLGEVSKKTTEETVRYFRLDYGLCESVLRSSGINFHSKSIAMKLHIYYGQVNAPEEGEETSHESIKEIRTATEFYNFLDNAGLTYQGDTLKLMNDIVLDREVNGSKDVNLNRALNLDLNGHHLTIDGDFNITHESSSNITINTSMQGQLEIKGQMRITVPNGSVTLYGDNARGGGDSNYDISVYSDNNTTTGTGIYNGVGNNENGLYLQNVYIVQKFLDSLNGEVTGEIGIQMQEGAALRVGNQVEVDNITSLQITSAFISNYGRIGQINFVSMIIPFIAQTKLRVYNNGYLGRERNSTQGTYDLVIPNSATPANTQIIKGSLSNNFTINETSSFKYSNITDETAHTAYVVCLSEIDESYALYIDSTVSLVDNSKIKYVLLDYFNDNPTHIQRIKKLVITTTSDTYINENDFAYMNSDQMNDLIRLDLSGCNVETTNYSVSTQRQYRIPDQAMQGKSDLIELTLPTNIKYIGTRAFAGTSINSVTIPSSIVKIGTDAFSSVSEVSMESLYPVNNNADFLPAFTANTYFLVNAAAVDSYKNQFKGYSAMPNIHNHVYETSIKVDNHYVKFFSNRTCQIVAFIGDFNEADIAPYSIEYNGVTYAVVAIGRDAYINATNVNGNSLTLHIGDGVLSIGSNAFANLTSIISVTSVACQYVDEQAFMNCTGLLTATFNGEVVVCTKAFSNCSALNTVNMPNATQFLASSFERCVSIRTLTIPNIELIGENAFSGCTSFEYVVLGRLTELSANVFKNCRNLVSIGLTDTTKIINDSAFENCVSLETIYVYESNEKEGYAFLDYITTIGNNAFKACTSLNNIYAPSLTTIGNSSFYGCTNLEYVVAENVINIGNQAFYNDAALKIMEMPKVQTIGQKAFQNTALIYVLIPKATSIGNDAFRNLATIKAISFGAISDIGEYAFYGVYPNFIDLTEFDFNDSMTALGGSEHWHQFKNTTKYYYDGTIDSANRKQRIYSIISESSIYSSNTSYQPDINLIYGCTNFAGDYLITTSDYDEEETITLKGVSHVLGFEKNLYLYGVDASTYTLLSYHGPKLTGNVVLPLQNANDMNISDADFEDRTSDYYSGIISYNGSTLEIRTIGEYSFYSALVDDNQDCKISFANTVTKIGKEAFRKSNIDYLYCNNVTDIGNNAFRNANELVFVDLENVVNIGDYAFSEVLTGDVETYYSTSYSSISYSTGKLTKVIFRHVNKVGKGAFMKRIAANSNFLLIDLTNNIPNASATDGFGPNGNIKLPTDLSVYWLGFSTKYWKNYDWNLVSTYLLAPYYSDQAVDIKNAFELYYPAQNIIYDYGYVYHPEYSINGVEVGMYYLRPSYNGDDIVAFYLDECTMRDLGKDDQVIEGYVNNGTGRSTFTCNNYVNLANVYNRNTGTFLNPSDFNGTTLKLTLTERCFRAVGAVSGKYCDFYINTPVDSAGDIKTIPEYCFMYSRFTDFYLYGITKIVDNAFRYSSINNIYGFRLESIGAYIGYYSSLSIIDLRQNKNEDGTQLICEFDENIIVGNSNIKNIYVTEDDYETYVAATKSIIAQYKYNNNGLDTDIELYLYISCPGTYIANLNLNYKSSYNFSSLLSAYESPYAALDEHLYWESTEPTISVINGIISYTGEERIESGYVKCYKTSTIEGVTTTTLLGYVKVSITVGDTEIEYYNITTKIKEIGNVDVTGYKIIDYHGTNLYGVFDPTVRFNNFITTVFAGSGFDFTSYNGILNHKVNGEYKIFELGIGSYRTSTASVGNPFYLYTDEYITEIGDYAFHQVPFYELWLTKVEVIGRKAFLNGSSLNYLKLVVMPNVQTIKEAAFSQNRELENIIIGDDCYSSLTTIGANAFYANTSLIHFGMVDVNFDTFTYAQYSIYFGSFDTLNAQYYKSQIKTAFGEDDYRYVNHYYEEADKFIYLPNSVTSIGTYSFYEVKSIEIVRLPNSNYFTKIPNYAFALSTNLKTVHTTEYINEVGNYAFQNCTKLGDPDYITYADNWWDYKIYKESAPDNEKIYLKSGIDFTYFKKIGNNAFAQCIALTNIKMSSVTSIGTAAFMECNNLRYIDFTGCTPDKNVTFGANWNMNNHALSRYFVDANYKQYFSAIPNTYVKNISYNNGEYYLSYVKNEYDAVIGVKIDCYNGETLVQIPTLFNIEGNDYNVVTIGKYAYKGYKNNSNIETIYLPNTVQTIEDYAFADCYFKYYEELPTTSTIQTKYGSYVFANNEQLISAKYVRMASGGDYEYSMCSSFDIMNLVDNYKRYSATSTAYYAPVIGDNFFTNSPSKAHCVIGAGTYELFTSPGYSGRVYEDSIQIGNYLVKIKDDNSISIIRYNGNNLSEEETADAQTLVYTVPLSLTDEYEHTYQVSEIGPGAYSSTTIASGWKLLITSNVEAIGTLAFNYTPFKYVEIQGNPTIGDSAFANMSSLMTIDMPNVTSLSKSIFKNDVQLTGIILNSAITVIPMEAFYGCNNLGEVKVSSNLTTIEANAFNGCALLKKLYNYNETSNLDNTAYLPITTTKIGQYSFYGCSSLQKFTALGLTSIGQYALANATGITSMTIGSSNSYRNLTVGVHAFDGMTALTNFSVQFTSIPAYCFYGCSALNNISITYVTEIGDYAFYGCSSIESIDFSQCSTIGDCAFYECTKLSSINFRNVSYLGSSCFYKCTSLTSIDFKNVYTVSSNCFTNSGLSGEIDLKNVAILGQKAFSNCLGITSVIFRKVYSIGSLVFENDNNISEMNFIENEIQYNNSYMLGVPTTRQYNSLGGISYPTNFIIYADGSVIDNYRTGFSAQARYIYEYGSISGDYMIKDKTLYGTNGVEIIKYLGTSLSSTYTVPNKLDGKTVISIGSYAYYNAFDEDVETSVLNLGPNVLKVGERAFYNFQFDKISLPSVKEVGSYAFYNNRAITHLSLPSCITIEPYAFANNTGLQIVRLYSPIRTVKQYAFNACYQVKSFYIGLTDGSAIASFCNNAGYHCFGVTDESDFKIRVPSAKLQIFKNNAITGNMRYYSSRLYAGEIDDADFSYRLVNGAYLEIIAYEGDALSCTVPSIIEGHAVTKILDEAFASALNLQEVTIPATLESISSHAFLGAVNLQAINTAGNGKFTSINGVLYMKTSSTGNICTVVAYPQAKTDTSYDFTASGYDLSHIDTVYENAFYGNTYLTSITVPNYIKYIGENAFASCPSLANVYFIAPQSGMLNVPTLYGTNIFTSCRSDLVIHVFNYSLFANDLYFSYYKSRLVQDI